MRTCPRVRLGWGTLPTDLTSAARLSSVCLRHHRHALDDVALLRSTPPPTSGGRSNLMPTPLSHPMWLAFLTPRLSCCPRCIHADVSGSESRPPAARLRPQAPSALLRLRVVGPLPAPVSLLSLLLPTRLSRSSLCRWISEARRALAMMVAKR